MLSVYSGMGLDLSQATVARQQQQQTPTQCDSYHDFMGGGCFSLSPYDSPSYYGNLVVPLSAGATNGNDWCMPSTTHLSSTATTTTTTTNDMVAAAAAAAAAATLASAPTAVMAVAPVGYVDRSASYYPSPPPSTSLSGFPVDPCVYSQPLATSPNVVMPLSPTIHQHHPGYHPYVFPGSPIDDGCNNNINNSLSRSGLTPSPYNYSPPFIMHHHPYHNVATRRSSMHTSRSSSPSTLSSMDTPSASSSTSTSSSTSISSNSSSSSVYYHPQRRLMATFNTKVTSSTPKRYKCNICGKKFTRPSSLNTHTYSHTGEKPFKCPVEGCGRHFSVVSNLRRHAKIHSNTSTTSATATSSVHSSTASS